MSGLPTPRDGRLHGFSWLASRGLSFPFLICTSMTFLRLWLLVTQKGLTFGRAFWRLMSTWQCGVMIMGAFGGANSSFTQYLFHMARKSAHAWFFVVCALDVCHMIKVLLDCCYMAGSQFGSCWEGGHQLLACVVYCSRNDPTLVPPGMVPPHRGCCIVMGWWVHPALWGSRAWSVGWVGLWLGPTYSGIRHPPTYARWTDLRLSGLWSVESHRPLLPGYCGGPSGDAPRWDSMARGTPLAWPGSRVESCRLAPGSGGWLEVVLLSSWPHLPNICASHARTSGRYGSPSAWTPGDHQWWCLSCPCYSTALTNQSPDPAGAFTCHLSTRVANGAVCGDTQSGCSDGWTPTLLTWVLCANSSHRSSACPRPWYFTLESTCWSPFAPWFPILHGGLPPVWSRSRARAYPPRQ